MDANAIPFEAWQPNIAPPSLVISAGAPLVDRSMRKAKPKRA
jgi:hypothetical protein